MDRRDGALLEVIDKGRSTDEHPVPLLFVHGALHAAWCWDEHFLDFFAAQGYRAIAVSLRGHGKSPGGERLRWTRIQEYADDVGQTAAQLPTEPVLIGHSMGGFVVQKYLEHTPPQGRFSFNPFRLPAFWGRPCASRAVILRRSPKSTCH